MVQGPLKCEWQYRLVDKGDWFVAANRRSRRLVEICAEKDATNSAKRVYVVGCFNPLPPLASRIPIRAASGLHSIARATASGAVAATAHTS